MQSKKFLFLFVLSFFATQIAIAQQWQFVGTRAMGMGGAGVATTYGPDAQYWNPAGLAQEDAREETGLSWKPAPVPKPALDIDNKLSPLKTGGKLQSHQRLYCRKWRHGADRT